MNNFGRVLIFFFLMDKHYVCPIPVRLCPLNFSNFSFSLFLSKSLAFAKSFFSYLLLLNYFIDPFWNLSLCIPDVTILIFPVACTILMVRKRVQGNRKGRATWLCFKDYCTVPVKNIVTWGGGWSFWSRWEVRGSRGHALQSLALQTWRDALCRIPDSIPDLYHVETWDLGHFPIPGTEDKAHFSAIHIY